MKARNYFQQAIDMATKKATPPRAPTPPLSRSNAPSVSSSSSPMNYSSSDKENKSSNPEYWTKIDPA